MAPQPTARVWLVNVEGTLVPRGQPMDANLRQWLLAFASQHDLRLVSDLDHAQIAQLVGPELLCAAKVVYTNRGNCVWARRQELHTLRFEPPPLLLPYLRELVKTSLFPLEHEPDIVRHAGMVRVRMLGGAATPGESESFGDWDEAYQERRAWSRALVSAFPRLGAMPQGDHCMDIYPAGRDRSQVLSHIHAPVVVVGDLENHSSCDAALAAAALERGDGSQVLSSNEWKLTWALLDSIRHRRPGEQA